MPKYPYIFVNLNKSATFYKIADVNSFTKLSGSIIGDSTIEALIQLAGLQGSLEEVFWKAFEEGDNSNVDLTVGDIYGKGCSSLKLPDELIASSMGKLQTINKNVNI